MLRPQLLPVVTGFFCFLAGALVALALVRLATSDLRASVNACIQSGNVVNASPTKDRRAAVVTCDSGRGRVVLFTLRFLSTP